jgi:hypothetical protein
MTSAEGEFPCPNHDARVERAIRFGEGICIFAGALLLLFGAGREPWFGAAALFVGVFAVLTTVLPALKGFGRSATVPIIGIVTAMSAVVAAGEERWLLASALAVLTLGVIVSKPRA